MCLHHVNFALLNVELDDEQLKNAHSVTETG